MFKNALLVALLLVTASAQAATIFSQTPPNQTGQLSDLDYGLGVHEADDFNLAANDTVLSVGWRGFYAQSVPTDGNPPNTPLATDDFTISFYSEAGNGLPGALLQSFSVGNPATRIDTGLDTGSSDIYEYTADLGTGISLTAGIDYWISIVADTTADLNDNWYWAGCITCEGGVVPPLGASATLNEVFQPDWVGNRAEYHFELSNSSVVPVPAAVWLFGSGLGLLGWIRRKHNCSC
jgi:hypothetical protein